MICKGKGCQNESAGFKYCEACRKAAREQVYKSREKIRKSGGMRAREREIKAYYESERFRRI